MGKKHYFVVIEWVDVFGDKHEYEHPCTNEKDMQRKQEFFKNSYKHDSLVASYKIYGICR